MIGSNTPSGEKLRAYIERIESLDEEAAALRADKKLVFAEAEADGYSPKAIRRRIKIRKMKPSEWAEIQAIDDSYAVALGEAVETPLHSHVAAMGVDITARNEVIDAVKLLVPERGAIVIEAGGAPLRLERDERGEVTVTEIVAKPVREPRAPRAPAGMSSAEVPDVSDDEAEALGRQAFRDDTPIIKNPFPHDDPRRWRWDAGWRGEAGSDGMGPGGE